MHYDDRKITKKKKKQKLKLNLKTTNKSFATLNLYPYYINIYMKSHDLIIYINQF